MLLYLALILLSIILFVLVLIVYLAYVGYVQHPYFKPSLALSLSREEREKNFFVIGKNRLRLSEKGHWELYIEGEPFDRGIIIGKLTRELFYKQEDALKKEIKNYVPFIIYKQILVVIVAWINRNISKKIPEEYLAEIYGIAVSLNLKYFYRNYKYFKMLNYHAAHDIGHALANLNLVGCTSFSVKGSKTYDGNVISGRNFDFHFGDDFSKEKIIAFYSPSK